MFPSASCESTPINREALEHSISCLSAGNLRAPVKVTAPLGPPGESLLPSVSLLHPRLVQAEAQSPGAQVIFLAPRGESQSEKPPYQLLSAATCINRLPLDVNTASLMLRFGSEPIREQIQRWCRTKRRRTGAGEMCIKLQKKKRKSSTAACF